MTALAMLESRVRIVGVLSPAIQSIDDRGDGFDPRMTNAPCPLEAREFGQPTASSIPDSK